MDGFLLFKHDPVVHVSTARDILKLNAPHQCCFFSSPDVTLSLGVCTARFCCVNRLLLRCPTSLNYPHLHHAVRYFVHRASSESQPSHMPSMPHSDVVLEIAGELDLQYIWSLAIYTLQASTT